MLKLGCKVLVMRDGAPSAYEAPYFLSNPSNMHPVERNGSILKFRYAEEAGKAAERLGYFPVYCESLKGPSFIQAYETAAAYNRSL